MDRHFAPFKMETVEVQLIKKQTYKGDSLHHILNMGAHSSDSGKLLAFAKPFLNLRTHNKVKEQLNMGYRIKKSRKLGNETKACSYLSFINYFEEIA